jgi:hypothetical protein
MLAALAALLAGLGVAAQQETRLVRGQVLNENGKAVENAIVHLKNLNTRETLSVVTDKQGRYRFNEVDKKTDHEIYAEWRDQKSSTRRVSQFDTRDIVTINLSLQPADGSDEKDNPKEGEEEPR